MTTFTKPALALVAVLAAGGYGYHRHQQRQETLWAQIRQLNYSLAALNDQTALEASKSFKSIENYTINHKAQATGVAIVQASQELMARTQSVTDTLRKVQRQLTSHRFGTLPALASTVAQLLPSRTDQRLRQQLEQYAAYMQPYYPGLGGPALALSLPDNASAALALVALTQLEADVLAAQAAALDTLTRRLHANDQRSRLAATVTAVSNVVAYGSTYQAELCLVNALYSPAMRMSCDGRPVPVGPDGGGLVRFVVSGPRGAVARPITRFWTGQITASVSNNGRDSIFTFRVRVPYQIVAR
jgi:hypothetical protein